MPHGLLSAHQATGCEAEPLLRKRRDVRESTFRKAHNEVQCSKLSNSTTTDARSRAGSRSRVAHDRMPGGGSEYQPTIVIGMRPFALKQRTPKRAFADGCSHTTPIFSSAAPCRPLHTGDAANGRRPARLPRCLTVRPPRQAHRLEPEQRPPDNPASRARQAISRWSGDHAPDPSAIAAAPALHQPG